MNKKNIIKYVSFALMIFLANSLVVFAGSNEYIECGGNSIPAGIAPVTRVIVRILQIALPLALIIVGSMDFLKAVIANDQEGIRKNQKQFTKRLVSGATFFFVIAVVQFVVSLVADKTNDKNISKCIDCLITDKSNCGSITTNNPFLYPEVKKK